VCCPPPIHIRCRRCTAATIEQPRIEALGDHDFHVRVAMDEDFVTIRVRATPEVVARVAGADADEIRVVAATMAFLTARQGADDLPEQLDLDDVVAAYDDYVEDIRTQLVHPDDRRRDLGTTTEDVARRRAEALKRQAQ
jgi:hypothetical protein